MSNMEHWDLIKDENSSNNSSNFEKTHFVKLTNDSVTLRILYPIKSFYTHFERDINGGAHRIVCRGTKNGCPICKRNSEAEPHTTRHRVFFKVIDRSVTPNVVGIFECGIKLARKIKDFMDEEHGGWGDTKEYDIKIIKNKTGNSFRDISYDAIPDRKNMNPLTEEELAMIENTKIDVSYFVREQTDEEIMALNLSMFNKSSDPAPANASEEATLDFMDATPSASAPASDDDWDSFMK